MTSSYRLSPDDPIDRDKIVELMIRIEAVTSGEHVGVVLAALGRALAIALTDYLTAHPWNDREKMVAMLLNDMLKLVDQAKDWMGHA
jgi:hypothetical protein